jgi:hypothetical protein
MTPEAKSVDVTDEEPYDAWGVGDELCMSLDWSRSANYAEPVG